ncbi:MAG: tyrosine protein phosphatase [Pseudomonadota bacterium]
MFEFASNNAGFAMPLKCDRDHRIHVCSLAALETVVAQTRATHVISAINPWSIPDTPTRIDPTNHLKIAMNDIVEPQPGLVEPAGNHIEELLAFIDRWNAGGALVIHCLAGISRSSAAAFIALCRLNEKTDEKVIATALREASSTATPNSRMIALADKKMHRCGRMTKAVKTIGRGEARLSGQPFSLAHSIS